MAIPPSSCPGLRLLAELGRREALLVEPGAAPVGIVGRARGDRSSSVRREFGTPAVRTPESRRDFRDGSSRRAHPCVRARRGRASFGHAGSSDRAARRHRAGSVHRRERVHSSPKAPHVALRRAMVCAAESHSSRDTSRHRDDLRVLKPTKKCRRRTPCNDEAPGSASPVRRAARADQKVLAVMLFHDPVRPRGARGISFGYDLGLIAGALLDVVRGCDSRRRRRKSWSQRAYSSRGAVFATFVGGVRCRSRPERGRPSRCWRLLRAWAVHRGRGVATPTVSTRRGSPKIWRRAFAQSLDGDVAASGARQRAGPCT